MPERPIDEGLVNFIVRDIRRTGLVMRSNEPELRVALERIAREDKEMTDARER